MFSLALFQSILYLLPILFTSTSYFFCSLLPNFYSFLSVLFLPKPNPEFPFIAAGKLLQTMHCFVMLPAFLQRIPFRLLFSSGTDKRVCSRSIPFAFSQWVWNLSKALLFVLWFKDAKQSSNLLHRHFFQMSLYSNTACWSWCKARYSTGQSLEIH